MELGPRDETDRGLRTRYVARLRGDQRVAGARAGAREARPRESVPGEHYVEGLAQRLLGARPKQGGPRGRGSRDADANPVREGGDRNGESPPRSAAKVRSPGTAAKAGRDREARGGAVSAPETSA